MNRIRIAIIGAGKIARDQHLPALRASDAYELVAVASPDGGLQGVQHYRSLSELLDAELPFDAVAICTPPQVRYGLARTCLQRGYHVLLEKPPGATLGEVESLQDHAHRNGVTLFTAWHSQEAAGVEGARQWLAQNPPDAVHVRWKEDVRIWHPGQPWIWRAGGLGVFDPGINALSILTYLLANPLRLIDAELQFPANCETPIAATLHLRSDHDIPIAVELSFRHSGSEQWDIDISSGQGHLRLSRGGAVLSIDGKLALNEADQEYPRLYQRFADLIQAGHSDVDTGALRVVTDAFLLGRRVQVEPFYE